MSRAGIGTVAWVACALVVAVVAVLAVRALDRTLVDPGGAESAFRGKFADIKPGMNRELVIRRLGPPSSRDTRFRLGQRKGFEREYARAEASPSRYFLFWEPGLDTVYAVGFDEHDCVTLTSFGGT